MLQKQPKKIKKVEELKYKSTNSCVKYFFKDKY